MSDGHSRPDDHAPAEPQRLIGNAHADPVAETLLPTAPDDTLEPKVRVADTEAVPCTERYEVVSGLGQGGMGTVYRARDRMLGRDVALKVIRADALTGDSRQRFVSEARAVAALDHPNVVKVYDVGEWAPPGRGPTPYLSLEFVPGGSLSRHLRGEPMEPREAARLVRLLARAVAHAHERGVVHRDLKPDNVLLAPAADEPGLNCALGCPKVGDFGLARQVKAGQRLTQTGAVLGTPAYMAPEQAAGEQAGPPCDVYALGVLLYRLLTGKVPFEAVSTVEVLYRVIREEAAPVRQVRPEAPAELEAVCAACMSKKPADRPTAEELAVRLGQYLDACAVKGTTAAPVAGEGETLALPLAPRPTRRMALGLGLAGVATLGLGGLGAWAWWSNRKPGGSQGNGGGTAGGNEPLTAELVVRVWAPKRGARGLRIGHDNGAVPVCEDEQLQAEVTLSEPAYAYLLWVDGKGEVTPLYPWNDDEIKVQSVAVAPPAVRAKSFRNPSRLGMGWPADETPGLDLWLLLARREPWPKGRNLAELIGPVPPAPLSPDNPGEVVVRGWDRGLDGSPVEAISPNRKKKADEIDDQLLRLVGRLVDDFEVIRAVQFAHAAKR